MSLALQNPLVVLKFSLETFQLCGFPLDSPVLYCRFMWFSMMVCMVIFRFIFSYCLSFWGVSSFTICYVSCMQFAVLMTWKTSSFHLTSNWNLRTLCCLVLHTFWSLSTSISLCRLGPCCIKLYKNVLHFILTSFVFVLYYLNVCVICKPEDSIQFFLLNHLNI